MLKVQALEERCAGGTKTHIFLATRGGGKEPQGVLRMHCSEM